MIRAAALTVTATLTVAACALTATRPADNNGDTPDTTTTTVTVPLAPLPDQLVAHVAAPAARHEAIQIAEPPTPPATTIALPPHHDIWIRLAECESGGNWSINTGNGYYGGLQFNLQTWRVAGGGEWATRPDWASPIGQMWTAERVLTLRAGWGMNPWAAWPACARRLGLR